MRVEDDPIAVIERAHLCVDAHEVEDLAQYLGRSLTRLGHRRGFVRHVLPLPLAWLNPRLDAHRHPLAARQIVKLAMGTGSPGGSAVSRDIPGGEDAGGVLDPGMSCNSPPLSTGAPLARGAAPTCVAEDP